MMFKSFMFISLIILSVVAPVLFANHDVSSKYFVYEYSFTDYENGKLSFSDKIVFKLISINETAYKVELIQYDKSTPKGKAAYESYMLLLDQTNAIIEIDQQSYLNILDLGFTEWIQPSRLWDAVENAGEILSLFKEACTTYPDIRISEYMKILDKYEEQIQTLDLALNAQFMKIVLQSSCPDLNKTIIVSGTPAETSRRVNVLVERLAGLF